MHGVCSRVVFLVVVGGWWSLSWTQQQKPSQQPAQEFKETLTKLAPASPDDCGWVGSSAPRFPGDTARLEDSLFEEADAAVVQSLNEPGSDPKQAVSQTLELLRNMSNRINENWPRDRRFHYEVLQIEPVFAVGYHIRSRSTWSAFAVADESEWPKKGRNRQWHQVGEDDFRWDAPHADQQMVVYPLQRGPSGLARFLARFSQISCGDGITGIGYDAYQWNPTSVGSLDLILERKGAASRGDFPKYGTIGKLVTSGPRITLPYCEWSALDMTPDALLCSVDTYDVSGNVVRFVSTQTNRPDLETVAKAIRYAEDRDYRAVLAYSASPAVARKMVDLMPPAVYGNASGEDYPPIRGNTQAIDIEGLHFALEKRDQEWVITQFQLNP
jgi:hypothetical protein